MTDFGSASKVPWYQRRTEIQRVEVDAARPLGKARSGDGDHALQDQRELDPRLVRHLSDRDGAGDVGRAVLILCSAVEQQQSMGF